ncbi:hypothetical protein KEJ26_02445 [Candidatus Bathyarchaeota archaeon]|nr:hypothetical protein [Candidatus Bathyarchaeota archaeon]
MSEIKRIVLLGITVSFVFVVVGCMWLSHSVETLDEVAEHFGASEYLVWAPPLPDYEIPGFEGNLAANIIVGIAFTLLTLALALVIGRALKAKT